MFSETNFIFIFMLFETNLVFMLFAFMLFGNPPFKSFIFMSIGLFFQLTDLIYRYAFLVRAGYLIPFRSVSVYNRRHVLVKLLNKLDRVNKLHCDNRSSETIFVIFMEPYSTQLTTLHCFQT